MATPGRTDARRRLARFPAGLPGEVRLPAARYPCEVIDLSRSGALLGGRFPATPTTRLDVRLSSSGGDLQVLLKARVVRVAPAGDRPGAGVAFEEVAPAEQQRFERLISRVIEGSGAGLLANLPPAAKPDEIRAVLARMPAAHRIGLAARAQARERRMLREDANPLVLEALARNPGGTVEEAVALARLPLLRPATLALLADEPRFRQHEELQILLASHPQASFETAARAAGRLGERGRTRLLARPHLHPLVRQRLVATGGRHPRA
jgi:hypothetical protein